MPTTTNATRVNANGRDTNNQHVYLAWIREFPNLHLFFKLFWWESSDTSPGSTTKWIILIFVPFPLTPICRLPLASRRNNLWTMLLSSSDNRWEDKEAPSGLRVQLNECWLERLPEGTKKIPSTNDFRFLGTFTIDRAFIAYLWISTICYLTLLIITVSRYKIVYNYRSYLILKTKVKKIVWMNLLEIQYI